MSRIAVNFEGFTHCSACKRRLEFDEADGVSAVFVLVFKSLRFALCSSCQCGLSKLCGDVFVPPEMHLVPHRGRPRRVG